MAIDRREFLSTLGTGAVLLAAGELASCALPQAALAGRTLAGSRPNMLVIVADDQSFTDSGAYGNPDVHTPNIDRLAKESRRFTNYFTAAPMCTPARSMLYTGMYPVKIGAYPNHSKAYDSVKSVAHYLKGLGYRVGLAGKTHIAPPEVFDFEYLSMAEDVVEKFMTRDAGQPFCLIFASHHPHAPWGRGGYDPAKLTLPPYLVDTPETRQSLADYYHDVTLFDQEVGMCLNILDKHQLVEGTLTLCTGDHGAQFPHGKWTCYDFGLKVGFMARWPGHIQPEVTCEGLACHADFVPTAIELAGGTPPPNLDGKSLLPLLAGKNVQLHDAVFGVQTTRGIIKGSECYPVRSVRTATHKYIWNLKPDAKFQNVVTTPRANDREHYWQSWIEKALTDPAAKKIVDGYQHRPEEELYDIVADPYEQANLAGDPQWATLKAGLRKRLEAFMKEQGDQGIATEMDAKNRQVAGPDRE